MKTRHTHKGGRRLRRSSTAVKSCRSAPVRSIGETKSRGKQQRQSRTKLEDARDFAQAIIDTVCEPVLVLDGELRVESANRAFYQNFQVSSEGTLNRLIYDLGNRQWDIPKLHELLETLLAHHTRFEDFEVRHRFESLGDKVMLLNARKLFNDGQKILLVIEDISERKQRSEILRETEEHVSRQLVEIEAMYHWAGVGLCVLDRDLRYVLVNERIAEMNGVPATSHIGKTIREIVPNAADQAERVARRVIETGQAQLNVELRGETKAQPGVERFWIQQWMPLKDERERVVAINVVVEEITERKRTEAALRLSESRFRMLSESIPQMVWTCDPEGECDYLNVRWAEYTGVPSSEQLGQRWVNAVHPDDRHRMWESFKAATQTGENFNLEYRLRNGQGDYRWFKVAAMPLLDPQGKVIKWFGTSTDIEEQKNYAAYLERTVEERTLELRRTFGELEGVSHSIAHGMRAPLRAMQGFGSILSEEFADKLGHEGIEYVQRIRNAANRLDRLIQDVLSYTRVIHGSVPMESLDVDKLLRDMIAGEPNWQPPKANVAVEGHLPPVLGNEGYLTQAISNLLSNAVKFVAPGTTPQVRVRAENVDGEVRLWFHDNGIGIEPQDQERIFKLLHRVHPETTYEGTGLGLSLVCKAVDRMGGRIGVQSQPGQGSSFWMQFKPAE